MKEILARARVIANRGHASARRSPRFTPGIARPSPRGARLKATLLDVQPDRTQRAAFLCLRSPEVRDLTFTPVAIRVAHAQLVEGQQITRPPIRSSKPDSNRFDLCLNLVEDGILSPWLFTLEPGAEIETTRAARLLRDPQSRARRGLQAATEHRYRADALHARSLTR